MISIENITEQQAYSMIHAATSKLEAIEFELGNGDSYRYLPNVSEFRHTYGVPITGETLQISLSNDMPSILIGCGRNWKIQTPVDFISQESVDKAVQKLWELEEQRFYSISPFVVEKTAWSQGSDFYQDILASAAYPVQKKVRWSQLCQFSQFFTNGGNTGFKPELVYMDNSGGFKSRGAWCSKFFLSEVNQNGITLTLKDAQPKDSISHDFGEWEGFEQKEGDIFLFTSCSGNTLVAKVDEQSVTISVSTEGCNYAKFWQQQIR